MTLETPAHELQLVALCNSQDVTTDMPLRIVHDDVAYAVFRCDDRIYVTQDQCTHGPGSLSEGILIDCEIECPFHQGRFDVRTGRPTAAPCTEGLRTWTAHEVDGRLFIDPAERRPVES